MNADFGLQTPGSVRGSGSSQKLNSLVPGSCPTPTNSSKSVQNFVSYPTSHLTNSFWQSKHGYLAANSNYLILKHFLPISISCKFHTFHVYRQIALLASSSGLPLLPKSIVCKFLQYDFTVKVHYMQIPRQPIYYQNRLLADSITCKFTQPLTACIV